MRTFVAAVTALALLPAGLWAAEIRGQVKSVDASRNRLTLTVDGKDRTIDCTPKCRVTTMVQSSRRIFPRRTSVQEYLSSLDQLQKGTQVTVLTETMDGAEMATQIQAMSSGITTTSGTGPTGGRLRILRR
jgi:hypothetical protein